MTDEELHERLVNHLLQHSVRTGSFVLKSGKESNWFIDSKQTICRPESMMDVAEAVLRRLPERATAIGGLTMGADGMSFIAAAHATANHRPLRAFSVRKEEKDHGGKGRIAGALDPQDAVVITEDTVTRGTSILEAALQVQSAGAEPVLLIALVDRGGTAGQLAKEHGFRFEAIVTAPDLGFNYEGGL